MADTLTTNYSWVMPQDQSSTNTWGVKLNADLQAIDNQVWTNAQASSDVKALSNLTASVPATFSFYNAAAASGQQLRWQWQMDTTPETVEPATGSYLNLLAYDNTSAPLATPLTFTRAGEAGPLGGQGINTRMTCNAVATFTQPVTFAGGQAITNASPGTNAVLNFTAVPISGGAAVLTGSIQGTPSAPHTGTPIPSTIGMFSSDTNTSVVITGAQAAQGGQVSVVDVYCGSGLNIRGTNGSISALNFFNSGQSGLGQQARLYIEVSSGQTYPCFLDCGAFTCSTSSTLKPGGGPWSATSDARIKTVEGEYRQGLAAVLGLRPVHYRYKGNDRAKMTGRFVGLVAQEVEEVMPSMVSKQGGLIDGKEVSDLRTLDTSELIYALVNSVKELKAEIDELKAKST